MENTTDNPTDTPTRRPAKRSPKPHKTAAAAKATAPKKKAPTRKPRKAPVADQPKEDPALADPSTEDLPAPPAEPRAAAEPSSEEPSVGAELDGETGAEAAAGLAARVESVAAMAVGRRSGSGGSGMRSGRRTPGPSEAGSLRFVAVARALATAARREGWTCPAFRSPPGLVGVSRTIRRRRDGPATVSVVLRGRPWAAVLADMVEGIVVTNRFQGTAADRCRTALWRELREVGEEAA